jgi:hypothetical protein
MSAGYTVETNGDVALTGATAKTVMSVINAANSLIRVTAFGVGFDGTSSTAEPVTVELCYSTQATAGTSTSHTIAQVRGGTRAVQATAARNYTAEPTALTVWQRWLVHPQTGLTVFYPLGREPECTVTADALLIRCTAPVAVNVQGFIEFEEG